MKKKFLTLIMLMLWVLSSCTSSKTDNTEKNVADESAIRENTESSAGDVLDAPEKVISQKELDKITLKYSAGPNQGGEWSAEDVVIGFDRSSVRNRYYMGYYFDDVKHDVVCDVKNGTEEIYLKNGPHDEYYRFDGKYYESFQAQEQGFLYDYAFFGFDYADYIENPKFEKLDDEEYNGKLYYSYVLTGKDKIYGDDINLGVLVDKETGIWVKTYHSVTEEEAAYLNVTDTKNTIYEVIISEVSFDALEVPGVTPTLMQPQIIYEENDVRIVAKSLDYNNVGYAATLVLETVNGRSSAISVQSNYFDINGLCVGGSVISYSCDAGETNEFVLDIPIDGLYESGIDIIDEIAMSLKISDSEFVQPDEPGIVGYYSDKAVIAERTEEKILTTDCPADFVQKVDRDGDILVDTNEISLTVCGFRMENGVIVLKAYCENRTDSALRTTVNFKSINGIETDLYGKITMQEGRSGYGILRLYGYELEKYGISDLEGATVNCEVYAGEKVIGSKCIIEGTEAIKLMPC